MKKIVKLTESDLVRIVKRVIEEETSQNLSDGFSGDAVEMIIEFTSDLIQKAGADFFKDKEKYYKTLREIDFLWKQNIERLYSRF